MRGARMKTISIGVARPPRVALPRASKDSRCRPYALRSTPTSPARVAPAAVARLPLSRSFHRSPRAGGRRSARTPSVISPLASRRRPSLGSHSLAHFTARLAPAAVARLALPRSFHRSPRAGGRRSARALLVISPLASRRRPSLGSHSLGHFTARLAPAAVARLALPSAGLHQVLFGELGGLDADHRVAEILADLHQHRGILEVRGGLHDGLRAPGRS